jgi:molybdopterin converting factor small subunit
LPISRRPGLAGRVRVLIPSQLIAYTDGASQVEAVGAVVDDLDGRFPGLKFRVDDEQDRVRKHIRLFIGQAETRSLAKPLGEGDELLIFGALSGG